MFKLGGRYTMVRGLCAATGLALALGSCDSLQVTVVPIQAVRVSPGTLELVIGQVGQLSASAVNTGGSAVGTSGVEWTAVNPAVVQVGSDGTVTGLGPGVSTVTAMVDGVAGSAVVSVAVRGTLVASVAELSFSAVMGAGNPAAQAIRLDEKSGLVRDLTVSVDYGSGPQGWLATSIDSDRAPANLSVVAETRGMAKGDYSARISVRSGSAANGPVTILVTLYVDDAESRVELTPSSVAAVGFDTVSVAVTNRSSGPASGLSSAIDYPAGGAGGWLTAVLRGQVTPTTLVLSSDPSHLSPGTHSAQVMVRASSGVAAGTIDVTITIALIPAGIRLSPGSLSLRAQSGAGASARVSIENTGNGALGGLSKAVSYAPGEPSGWLVATLPSTSAPTALNLLASTNGLALGSYSASVEVSAPGASNSPVFLPVILTVSAVPLMPPAPPTGLTATAATATTVDLSWADASSNESGFEIQRGTPGGIWTLINTTTSDVTAHTDTTVTAGSTYDYEVRACNAVGCSSWSPPATVTVPIPLVPTPIAPSNLTLSAPDSTAVDVRWDDNSTTETAFELERRLPGGAWSILYLSGADVTAFADSSVTPGATYEYQVRACNGSGCSAWSSTQSATVPVSLPSVPFAPTGASVVVLSAIHIDVGWSDNSSDETHFEIERSISGGAGATIASPSTNTTSYRDAGLTAGAQADYRVRACNSVGCSSWSAAASGTTQDPKKAPRSPKNPSILSASPQAVVIGWTDHSPDETYFEIEEYLPSTGWTVIGTADVNNTAWTDTNVDRGRLLQYHVRACNPVGCSGTWTASVVVP